MPISSELGARGWWRFSRTEEVSMIGAHAENLPFLTSVRVSLKIKMGPIHCICGAPILHLWIPTLHSVHTLISAQLCVDFCWGGHLHNFSLHLLTCIVLSFFLVTYSVVFNHAVLWHYFKRNFSWSILWPISTILFMLRTEADCLWQSNICGWMFY